MATPLFSQLSCLRDSLVPPCLGGALRASPWLPSPVQAPTLRSARHSPHPGRCVGCWEDSQGPNHLHAVSQRRVEDSRQADGAVMLTQSCAHTRTNACLPGQAKGAERHRGWRRFQGLPEGKRRAVWAAGQGRRHQECLERPQHSKESSGQEGQGLWWGVSASGQPRSWTGLGSAPQEGKAQTRVGSCPEPRQAEAGLPVARGKQGLADELQVVVQELLHDVGAHNVQMGQVAGRPQ